MTIYTIALFTSLNIYAYKGRYVVIFDVPWEYLNSDMTEDKFILLNIEGEFVHIMCEVNPKQKKNVRVKNRVNLLYLQLIKYLYVCMESTLLWYNLYSKTLKIHGFMVNPYYRCMENSTIKVKQCTISWYVYKNKILHIDEEVNTKVIETIVKYFGNLKLSRGKNHKLPEMDIEFLVHRKLSQLVKDYTEVSINFFSEKR